MRRQPRRVIREHATATVTQGITFGASPVGKITVGDATNASATPSATYATTLDWTNFQSPYRGWGFSGALAFPDVGNQGSCDATNTTCAIYDWRLKSADTVALGVMLPLANGDTVTWKTGSIPAASILDHAVELTGDGVGDDDGYCESNEDCLYTPNIGAYQGEGTLTLIRNLTGTTITNVNLYQYTTNGY